MVALTDTIMCAKFQNEIFRERFYGDGISHFMLIFALKNTAAVQRYCAACDVNAIIKYGVTTGSCPRLIVPRTRLNTIGDRSFPLTVARAWNSLPTSITALSSLPSFKRQLKTFLFTKSFPSV